MRPFRERDQTNATRFPDGSTAEIDGQTKEVLAERVTSHTSVIVNGSPPRREVGVGVESNKTSESFDEVGDRDEDLRRDS